MKNLKIHDEIVVNEDAERVIATGSEGHLCAAPGLGLWAGRHLFYVKQYQEAGGMNIIPLTGDELTHEDVNKALGLDDLIVSEDALVGIDRDDIALLIKRMAILVMTQDDFEAALNGLTANEDDSESEPDTEPTSKKEKAKTYK